MAGEADRSAVVGVEYMDTGADKIGVEVVGVAGLWAEAVVGMCAAGPNGVAAAAATGVGFLRSHNLHTAPIVQAVDVVVGLVAGQSIVDMDFEVVVDLEQPNRPSNLAARVAAADLAGGEVVDSPELVQMGFCAY